MTKHQLTIEYSKIDRSTGKMVASHAYQESWEKTNYFCPCCAAKNVWNRCDGGDYYQGEQFMCTACGVDWNWPSEPSVSNSILYPQDEQRLEQLRRLEKAG